MASNSRKIRRALERGKSPDKLKLFSRNPHHTNPTGYAHNEKTKSTFYRITEKGGKV